MTFFITSYYYFDDPYEDVAPVVAFMASDYAHYMNGQFISKYYCSLPRHSTGITSVTSPSETR